MNKQKTAAVALGCALAISLNCNAQFNLTGKVKANTGEPLPFALVAIGNSQLSCVSGTEGGFKFSRLSKGTYVLITKSMGYADRLDTIVMNGDMNLDPILTAANKQLDEVVVGATRADKGSGMAYNNIDAETLQKQNLGQDAPFILGQLPNAVVNSDAGAGVGYTGIRIRGSDATRINVTINGVPANDAESQGAFFINMTDLVSSANNIQVQRGVGTSGNGAGAFGATINFQTNQLNDKPYARAISTAGTFNTFRNTLLAGTGLLNGRFTLDARASKITSDGYIDRASSNLNSYYLSGGYYGKKSVLKFINFMGTEKTYQAWNYVAEDSLKAGNRTFNSCGLYFDAQGRPQYYKNETDNYRQNNFQLHFIHTFNSRFTLNITGHYTKGAGFFEQYKDPSQDSAFYSSDSYLSTYGLQDVIIGNDTILQTPLVRRLWLDNDFSGGIFNFYYKASPKVNITLGGGYNTYFGKHFDRLMWARHASNSSIDYEYSQYTTDKSDGNVYLKINYRPLNRLNVFADMQVRNVAYRYFALGDLVPRYTNKDYLFFNPKLGLSFDVNSNLNLYTSLSVANREPTGGDLVKNLPALRPQSEQMFDLEAGVKYTLRKIYFAVNLYNMQYNNQLVLNGQIDNVGGPRHVNVAASYRRGAEIEVTANVNRFFNIGGNVAISQNKIRNFTEYIDEQHINKYKNSDISFSPGLVASAIAGFKPFKDFEISFINKYVSRQFLDNTSNIKRSIHPYNVLDMRLNYFVKTKLVPEINLTLSVYNILNERYETNGYTYSYYEGNDLKTFNFLAPAAGTYFLAGLSLGF